MNQDLKTLESNKKAFDARHDFEDEDITLLKERHPSVEIINVPTAWVLPIDYMLCDFRHSDAIRRVEQCFGQLCITFKNRQDDQGRFEKYKVVISKYEEMIREIDADLSLDFKVEGK